MSSWSRFPFVRITLVWIGGILVARYWEGSMGMISSLLGLLLLMYFLTVQLVSPVACYAWTPVWGLMALGSIFLLSCLRFWINDAQRASDHLMQLPEAIEAYEAIALEDMHQKAQRGSVVVAVCRVRLKGTWQRVRGKVQISFPLLTAPRVHYGDVVLVYGAPRLVSAARNPYEFDYASFLELSQIYHQHFVSADQVAVLAHKPPNPVQACSFQVLRYCQSLLSERIRPLEARAVILALVLGQQDALTSEVRASYIRSGTMHVLAVSGLHVGILYSCLSLLLGILKFISKARWLSLLVSIVVLWFYAFVTGLSPSVLRATTMFTLVAISTMLGRPTSIYNTLAASAFLLLFWNPMMLFCIGFQLSYLAVLGIVYLQPRIYRLLTPNHRLLAKLWLLTSVSLGAQIATTPLSIYYFHQFPTYFLVTNWVVVPAAFAIFCLGLVVLMTNFWPILSILSAWLLTNVVLGVNACLAYIQKLPYSLVSPIYWNTPVVVLLYGLLVLWFTFLCTKQIKYLIAITLVAMLLSLHTMRAYHGYQTQCKLIFYSIEHHQVIAFVKGRHSTLCVDNRFDINAQQYVYHVQPSQIALGIASWNTYNLEEIVQQSPLPIQVWHGVKVVVWQGQKIMLLDKHSKNLPCLATKIYTDFLVVEENAVATLQPLLDRFDIGTLVIGASNRRSLSQQLQEEATQHGLFSHSLLQQGALTVSW